MPFDSKEDLIIYAIGELIDNDDVLKEFVWVCPENTWTGGKISVLTKYATEYEPNTSVATIRTNGNSIRFGHIGMKKHLDINFLDPNFMDELEKIIMKLRSIFDYGEGK